VEYSNHQGPLFAQDGIFLLVDLRTKNNNKQMHL